nr:uncharacterized protein LOC128688226 [Cherax quadricarinatus]XP_053631908.1 uncharacterized protein LOC128688226 [Cherax quadricarinatus]
MSEIYRQSKIGKALLESLEEMMENKQLKVHCAEKVKIFFDQKMTNIFRDLPYGEEEGFIEHLKFKEDEVSVGLSRFRSRDSIKPSLSSGQEQRGKHVLTHSGNGS